MKTILISVKSPYELCFDFLNQQQQQTENGSSKKSKQFQVT